MLGRVAHLRAVQPLAGDPRAPRRGSRHDQDGRRRRLPELHGRRNRRGLVQDAEAGDRRGQGDGQGERARRRRLRRQRGVLRRADRPRDVRPELPHHEGRALRPGRHHVCLSRGEVRRDARADRQGRSLWADRRRLRTRAGRPRPRRGEASLRRRQLLRQRQADRRGRRPAAVRRRARVGNERQGRLDVEPDPLGEPAHDQRDVRAANRLPLSIHGARRRARRDLSVLNRGLVLAAAAAAAVLALAPPALAGEHIDAAIAALRSDPVYVDPSAELAINASDQTRLRRTIDSADAGPVYIAILPLAAEQEIGGDPNGVLQALHDGLVRPGTYAVVVGRHFRAGSEGVLPSGLAGRLATEALDAHRGDGVTTTLIDFVHRVAAAQQSGGAGGDGNDEPGTGGGVLIGLLIFGAVAFLVTRAVRNRRRSQAELAEVKAAAHDDLIALADDVQKLEQPVESNAQAKQEYTQALDFYDQASGAY